MKNNIFNIAALLTFIFISSTINAEEKLNEEINYLFDYIAESKCIFVRNEKKYDSNKTILHLKKKFACYQDRIHTTEDFINLTATKSVISKKPYHIECTDHPVKTSREWLLNELQRYRANNI
jgi:Family of unknown function (DUF5329)